MQHAQHPPPFPQTTPPPPAGPLFADGLSCRPDPSLAAAEAADRAAASLAEQGHNAPVDALILFYTASHAPSLARVESALTARLAPRHIIGCSVDGLLSASQEIESGPALCLLAARLPGVAIRTFTSGDLPGAITDAEAHDTPPPEADLAAVAFAAGIGPGHRATILLADPFTTPADSLLTSLNRARALASPHGAGTHGDDSDHRRAPIVGGFASAAARIGGNTLTVDGRLTTTGCVGISLSGAIRADSLVSQGCRPIGPNLIVTSSQGQFIRSLGGRPALAVLEEIIESLDDATRAALGGGLLLGRVVNEYKDHFGRADYLMRPVLGVLKQDKALAIGDRARVGQTVRFHVRDAATAGEDLAMLLDAQALHEPPAAALLFTCNGRGTRLFNTPHHDTTAIQCAFRQDQPAEVKAKAGTAIHLRPTIPLAGMFAAGEIGPVGDQAFLHAQTLSALLLRKQSGPPNR